jgi:hypothetical protein
VTAERDTWQQRAARAEVQLTRLEAEVAGLRETAARRGEAVVGLSGQLESTDRLNDQLCGKLDVASAQMAQLAAQGSLDRRFRPFPSTLYQMLSPCSGSRYRSTRTMHYGTSL